MRTFLLSLFIVCMGCDASSSELKTCPKVVQSLSEVGAAEPCLITAGMSRPEAFKFLKSVNIQYLSEIGGYALFVNADEWATTSMNIKWQALAMAANAAQSLGDNMNSDIQVYDSAALKLNALTLMAYSSRYLLASAKYGRQNLMSTSNIGHIYNITVYK